MADQRFSDFTDGGEIRKGDIIVGLRTSDLTQDYKFDFPGNGIKDVNGNYIFKYATAGASSVNAPKLINSISGTAVIYTAEGTDSAIDISIQPIATGKLILDDLTWPTADGAPNTFMKTDGFGNLSFTATTIVMDITGTANQVLVNGTFGVPVGGSVTLTTPQDIAQTSSPTFNVLTLTTPLNLTSGGTNKALTASAGGIVWTDANSMEILSGTSTALQMLQSGNLATPTWSTATWPATTTINQILYSSAANTVTGLATANSAMIFTNSTGIPAWSTSMTNGQLMIGSTGASPAPATLSAGTGIGIVNGANSITISSTGGGMSWTNVTGTAQSMSPDNGYIANNAALVTLTLPVTAAFGTAISVIGGSAGGGWLIAQNGGQSIRFGNQTTTVGVGGSLASTNAGDSIDLICTTADTVWTVRGAPQSALITVV